MSLHPVEFFFAVSLFLIALLGTGATAWRRGRRLSCPDSADSPASVEALVARLVTVDRHKLELVAGAPRDQEPEAGLESWQVAELVGGLAGLEAMAANCEVLIALASHVQRWYPEALPVAEQLRLNTREILWHLDRLRGAESRGHLETVFPDYAQRAVAIYYSMTQGVLALYEATGVPGATVLPGAL